MQKNNTLKEEKDEKKDDNAIQVHIAGGPSKAGIKDTEKYLHLAVIFSKKDGQCLTIDWVNETLPLRARIHKNKPASLDFLFGKERYNIRPTKPYNVLTLDLSIIGPNLNDLAAEVLSLPFAGKKYNVESQNCYHCTYDLLNSKQFNKKLNLRKFKTLWNAVQEKIKRKDYKTELSQKLIDMNKKAGRIAIKFANEEHLKLDNKNKKYVQSDKLSNTSGGFDENFQQLVNEAIKNGQQNEAFLNNILDLQESLQANCSTPPPI